VVRGVGPPSRAHPLTRVRGLARDGGPTVNDATGTRVVRWRRGWHGRRAGRWLPRSRETFLRVEGQSQWLLIQWLPREGYWVVAAGLVGASADATIYTCPRYQSDAMKRRVAMRPGDIIVPPISATSTHWPKLPAIRAFLHETSYEDKTPRQPGYMTVRNKVTTMEVTLYDVDGCCRLVVRGPTLDHALSLAEQLLGVEDAAWEPDRYLAEQAARNKPKKKGA